MIQLRQSKGYVQYEKERDRGKDVRTERHTFGFPTKKQHKHLYRSPGISFRAAKRNSLIADIFTPCGRNTPLFLEGGGIPVHSCGKREMLVCCVWPLRDRTLRRGERGGGVCLHTPEWWLAQKEEEEEGRGLDLI